MSDTAEQQDQGNPDAEVQKLLEEASRQYEHYIQLANLADFSRILAYTPPRPPRDDLPLSLTIQS